MAAQFQTIRDISNKSVLKDLVDQVDELEKARELLIETSKKCKGGTKERMLYQSLLCSSRLTELKKQKKEQEYLIRKIPSTNDNEKKDSSEVCTVSVVTGMYPPPKSHNVDPRILQHPLKSIRRERNKTNTTRSYSKMVILKSSPQIFAYNPKEPVAEVDIESICWKKRNIAISSGN